MADSLWETQYSSKLNQHQVVGHLQRSTSEDPTQFLYGTRSRSDGMMLPLNLSLRSGRYAPASLLGSLGMRKDSD